MGDSKMAIHEIMAKAYKLKEDTYGDDGAWVNPREIRPKMLWWSVSLISFIIGMFVISGWEFVWVAIVWATSNYAFFNSEVKL